jgi:hypothetical protein
VFDAQRRDRPRVTAIRCALEAPMLVVREVFTAARSGVEARRHDESR